MKSVFKWLADPYVHLIVGGLVLFRLASGDSDVDPTEPVFTPPSVCQKCHDLHDPDVEFCPHQDNRPRVLAGASGRDVRPGDAYAEPSRQPGEQARMRRSNSPGRA